MKEADEHFKVHQDWGDLGRLMDLPKAIPGLTHSGITIVSGTPAPQRLPDGVCFVNLRRGRKTGPCGLCSPAVRV